MASSRAVTFAPSGAKATWIFGGSAATALAPSFAAPGVAGGAATGARSICSVTFVPTAYTSPLGLAEIPPGIDIVAEENAIPPKPFAGASTWSSCAGIHRLPGPSVTVLPFGSLVSVTDDGCRYTIGAPPTPRSTVICCGTGTTVSIHDGMPCSSTNGPAVCAVAIPRAHGGAVSVSNAPRTARLRT